MGIVEKIISFIFLVPSSMLSTVSALGAQNVGAGKHDRAAGTLYYAIVHFAELWGHRGVCWCSLLRPQCRGAVYHRCRRGCGLGGWYLRGYIWDCFFAGYPFQLQRVFLRLRPQSELSFLHNIIGHRAGAGAGGVSDVQAVPGQPCCPWALPRPVGSLLSVLIPPDSLPAAETQRHLWRESSVNYYHHYHFHHYHHLHHHQHSLLIIHIILTIQTILSILPITTILSRII